MPDRMLLGAVLMNSPAAGLHGLWSLAGSHAVDYTDLQQWVELAQILERGRFDLLFLADALAVYDNYRGGMETAVAEAVSFPMNDPSILMAALVSVTTDLGLAFTSSILQDHPFDFARRVSTLDHLSKGRAGWNIVTTSNKNAARNLSLGALPRHADRYAQADEYANVCYKLWEGSWEEDAVIIDRVRRMYADPTKVHEINHSGSYYQVAGPHMAEPSPQRTPLLFQAGTSNDGRSFAARNAECMFIASPTPEKVIADVRSRARAVGRPDEDILFFQSINPILGGTQEEAEEKAERYRAERGLEGVLTFLSGAMDVDFATIDLDAPVGSFKTEATQGALLTLAESTPDKTLTWRQVVEARAAGNLAVGTPEQVADQLESLHRRGINGFLVSDAHRPGTFTDFVDQVVPILTARALVQSDYRAGTLREKIFGSARLPERHPAARYRRRTHSR
jgi:FMN-dependent oxidoreductase (nitrilotriacetate monooxygenase family)